MLTDYELMNIHARLLFTYNDESRLLFVNEPAGTNIPAPRLFLGRAREGNLWKFRADLQENLIYELSALCADEPINPDLRKPPRHFEKYLRLLETHALVQRIETGPAYHFTEYFELSSDRLLAVTEKNAELLRGGFEELIADVSVEQPFVALIEENRAVSVCRSVRILPEAHEAGVETLPDFRGKGHATVVAAEWARLVRASGALPLYSTSWENAASQAVARKLKLKIYGVDFQIT